MKQLLIIITLLTACDAPPSSKKLGTFEREFETDHAWCVTYNTGHGAISCVPKTGGTK